MQQARRWRRRRPATWQVVLARWFLALAVILLICPSGLGPSSIVRAQDTDAPEDEPIVSAPAPILTPPHPDEPLTPVLAPVAQDEGVPAPQPTSAAAMPDGTSGVRPWGHRARQAATTCPADHGILKAASFGPNDRLVMTYYYYWYDQASLLDPAMSQHPPADPPLDWRSVAWHERQFADMASAGVDVALAVYWGDTDAWSVQALAPMVQARENLLAAGLRPPAIGLFFDTNLYAQILPDRPELADLTTEAGLDMLAHQVGTYLEQVPPCHRARVDGRPLAFFWRADTEDGDYFTFDDRTFAGLQDRIEADYGERIHPVLEHSWQIAAREAGVELGAVDLYRWGAALNGPRFEGRTTAIGPGYDDTNIEGRPGYTRERVSGATYSRDLRSAVMSGATWLLLETWNELWEGTAIAETQETGRTYLGITARYAALFHQLGNEPASDGWFDLGTSQNAYLRRLADAPVEQGFPASEDGRSGARPLVEESDGTGYFHFALDPRLSLTEPQPLTVQVEYFDAGEGSFALEYDSLDPDAPGDGAYKVTEPVTITDSRTWRTHRFELPDASLRGRQYDNTGDFRLHDRPGPDGELHVFGRVTVTALPASRPVAIQPESLSFVEPTPSQVITLSWSPSEPAPGYLVVIQPLADQAAAAHGFTPDERERCTGQVEMAESDETRGLTRQTTCELRLADTLEEGVYRWRVQSIDAYGNLRGEPSDWAFFVVARR